MTIASIPNPDLAIAADNKPRWELADHRRHGFHNLHRIARYSLSFRAPSVLPLVKQVDWTIGERPDVARFLAMPHFSAFVVVQGNRILYEAYAPDFGPDMPHSIQSVTKTTLNLLLGRCVADGLIDLGRRVRHYLPEIGTGYADATVRDVADMNVANDFSEDSLIPIRRGLPWSATQDGACPRRARRRGQFAPSSVESLATIS